MSFEIPEIPLALRRDANNRAPFMDLCDCDDALDENIKMRRCPVHGTSPATNPPAIDPNWVPPWASK